MAEISAGRHDRAGIVDVALRILDAHGLADLTMRRLATELDVRASALYWHFESKQVLLAAVADRIVAEAAAADDAEPVVVATALRDALLAHRDGAEVVLSTQALALGEDAPRRRIAASLVAALDPDDAEQAATIVLQFVLGHASLVQQRIQAASLGVIEQDPATATADADADFRRGIRIILAGLPGPASA
ncbi:TetR family transcriptional regulator [Microbacterium betulae]|uniref:TetR family transcriptional regulator n=1 Tax=Microbacterium betulae TaxID=2981139 RepID=A0AA97FGM0_9MICO|nr:TetR family transcriptional regulator [Microbacterium sp. AB]WOF21729.1 TetR family transcriptional regulator [Microbacterium sp. AB]